MCEIVLSRRCEATLVVSHTSCHFAFTTFYSRGDTFPAKTTWDSSGTRCCSIIHTLVSTIFIASETLARVWYFPTMNVAAVRDLRYAQCRVVFCFSDVYPRRKRPRCSCDEELLLLSRYPLSCPLWDVFAASLRFFQMVAQGREMRRPDAGYCTQVAQQPAYLSFVA